MSTTISTSAPSKEKYQALLASASKTAGSDSWKTAAGRVDGPDGFVAADAWRLLKLRVRSASKPAVCPVCLDRPSSDDEWYITKSCRHAVCKTCLQNYASSLVSDPNHAGPLKCPCCPRLLRVQDAKFALDKGLHGGGAPAARTQRKGATKAARRHGAASERGERGGLFADPDDATSANLSALEDLEKWDDKKRDELLRSMPAFRPCPHCGGGSSQDSDGRAGHASCGGGFVTPSCLQPINEERESHAKRLLNMGEFATRATLLAYFAFYWYCASRTSARPTLQVASALLPAALVPVAPHALRLLLAALAKREMLRPLVVACPCCRADFCLDAAAELRPPEASADAATQRWKDAHTRPCPRCASPIMKDGGCNHVKCGRCHAHFCWACMRLRTSCRAFRCQNGAPFGDGSPGYGKGRRGAERERQGMTLLERIDGVEDAALRNLRLFRSFPFRYAAVMGVMCALTSSATIQRIPSAAAAFLFSNLSIVLPAVLCCFCRRPRQTEGPRGGLSRSVARESNRQAQLLFQWLDGFRREGDQIAEATARSLVEQ